MLPGLHTSHCRLLTLVDRIETNRTIVRQMGDLTIPDELSEVVHMVAGLSEFPIPHYRSIPAPPSNGT